MKKVFTLTTALYIAANSLAQTQGAFSYQQTIRKNNNLPVVSNQVAMLISILQGSPSGTAVYSETQTAITGTDGWVNLEIGRGIPVSGFFSNINWAQGPYFIKTETDTKGGANYTVYKISEFSPVEVKSNPSENTPATEHVSPTNTNTVPLVKGEKGGAVLPE